MQRADGRARRRRRGRGDVAVVGHGRDRSRRHGAARRDHLDGRAGRGGDARASSAARCALQGYEPRKLRTWISRTGGAPALSGKDSISHILWLQRERPDIARATWKYLEPKDWLNFRLTGPRAATYDSIVLHWVTDNRDAAHVDYDPRPAPRRAARPRAAARSRRRRPSVLGAAHRRRPRRQLGFRPASPVVGGTPDLQSAAIGSGAVRDFEGHLYVGTSSWLTCHVPFKKTDLFHGIASLPSPLPGKYYVADEQEVAGGCLDWLRDHALETADDLAHLDEIAGDGRARQQRSDLHAVAERRAHAGRRPHAAGRMAQPVARDDARRAGAVGARRRRVQQPLAAARRWRSSSAGPFPWLHFIGGGAQSELWCRIMADVLASRDPPGRAPDPGQRPRRRAARGHRARPGRGRRPRPQRPRRRDVRARIRRTARVYDDRYAEFRVLHKQTSRRTKRHGA